MFPTDMMTYLASLTGILKGVGDGRMVGINFNPFKIQNLNNTGFVDSIMSKVLHDLPFSQNQNQPLKLVGD
jgi:hypothetical protein